MLPSLQFAFSDVVNNSATESSAFATSAFNGFNRFEALFPFLLQMSVFIAMMTSKHSIPAELMEFPGVW